MPASLTMESPTAASTATVAEFAAATRRFLDSLDPAHTFGDDALESLRQGVEALDGYATALRDAWDGVPPVSGAEVQLRAAVARVHEALPDPTSLSDRLPEWFEFRDQLAPLYERLAAALQEEGVDARPLRPSNYTRSLFHASSGLVAIAVFETGLDLFWVKILAVAVMLSGWAMEISRTYSPRINDLLMWVFGSVAHPHEAVRINSATWYSTAAAIITLLSPNFVGVLALLVLSVGDPMAGLVGRRFGRTKLMGPKSLEGFAAFVTASLAVGLLYLGVFHPELDGLEMLMYASAAALFGAVAELGTSRLDDNFTIPVAAMIAGWTLGVLL